jgi:integrase/recombinase XerD
MPTKLSTTVSKIQTISNPINANVIEEFHKCMKENDSSERHQNNALKVVIAYAKFLGSDNTFYDIKHKEQITGFLDTKIKSVEQDADKKWITTWNHYLHRISICLDGSTIRVESMIQYHNQNGLHLYLPK